MEARKALTHQANPKQMAGLPITAPLCKPGIIWRKSGTIFPRTKGCRDGWTSGAGIWLRDPKWSRGAGYRRNAMEVEGNKLYDRTGIRDVLILAAGKAHATETATQQW